MTAPPPLEQQPVVIRDVFPAAVSGRDAYPLRVLITRVAVYLFQAEAGRPRFLDATTYHPAASEVPDPWAPRTAPARLEIDGGLLLTVTRGRGCGCGNVLKVAPLSALLPGATRGR